jgi:hypothetical protein
MRAAYEALMSKKLTGRGLTYYSYIVREREREAFERVVGDLLVVVPEMVEKNQ